MKSYCNFLCMVLLAAFASHAFGAKLNLSKRNVHRSEHRRVVHLLENVKVEKSSEALSAIQKTTVISDTAHDNAPLSILKLCENTGKMSLRNNSGVADFASNLNQVPLPGAVWLLTSGLLALFHKSRQRIVLRL